jgi:hypothetical protein
MAIINSLAVRGARKSMGGITYTQLKGQNVSKQQVGKKGAIPPADRTPAQNRMSNIVMSYKVLSGFLNHAQALCKQKESIFNAFVRGFVNQTANAVQQTRSLAVAQLLEVFGLSGNFATIIDLTRDDYSLYLHFNTNGLQYQSDTIIRVALLSISGETLSFSDIPVSEIVWLSGITEGVLYGEADLFISYMYSTKSRKCSNIAFLQ